MKNIITAITVGVCLFCIAFFAGGCGGGKGGTVQNTIALSDVNEFPITKEPTSLSVFAVKNPYIENLETNEFTKWYEEKTNVRINWNIASGEARQAFNLMLASGEYNDVIINLGMSKSQLLDYSNQGIIIDLSRYIDKHGYYIKEMFEKNSKIREELLIGNAIYGLPQVNEGYRYEYKEKMWVYKPWLERLGLSIPETTEEFYSLLKAFKEKDPNGNGLADEIPLVARGVSSHSGIEAFLMSAFIPDDGSSRIYIDNKGKVQYTAVQPEFREGLRYIKKLYDEGLLYADTFILDRAQIMSIGENEPVILGCGTGMFPGMFTISNGNSPRYYEYTAIPPLMGPNGVRAAVKVPTTYGGNFSVTSACRFPEVAVKWIDFFYSDEGKKLSQSDTSSSVKRDAREGELGYDGLQAKWAVDKAENEAKDDSGMAQNRNWHNFGVWFSDFEASVKTRNYNDILDTHGEWYKAYANYDKYKVESFIGDMAIPEEDLEDYTDIKTALQNVDVSFASFVVGDLSLDNDWDSTVESFNSLGLPRYLEIIQKAHDASK